MSFLRFLRLLQNWRKIYDHFRHFPSPLSSILTKLPNINFKNHYFCFRKRKNLSLLRPFCTSWGRGPTTTATGPRSLKIRLPTWTTFRPESKRLGRVFRQPPNSTNRWSKRCWPVTTIPACSIECTPGKDIFTFRTRRTWWGRSGRNTTASIRLELTPWSWFRTTNFRGKSPPPRPSKLTAVCAKKSQQKSFGSSSPERI